MRKLFKNNPLRPESNRDLPQDENVNTLHYLWVKNSRTLDMLGTELQRSGYGKITPDIIDTIRETFKSNPEAENMSPNALREALQIVRKEARVAIQSYRVTQQNYNVTAFQNTQKRLQETMAMYQIVSEAFYKI